MKNGKRTKQTLQIKRKAKILNLKAKRGEATERNEGIEPASYSQAAKRMEEDPVNYEHTKVKIVKTLEGINGTM